MKKTILFKPSPKQMMVWNTLKGNYCDKCGGTLTMTCTGRDEQGNDIVEPVCEKCGNRDIAEQVLGGGAAGGGKSYLGCAWCIISCLTYDNILMVIARKELKTLLATTWTTMMRIMEKWGLEEGRNYHYNRQRNIITFQNGSQIMGLSLSRSLQDPEYNRLGSLEITGGFIDEVSEIEEKAVEVLASRIRYNVRDTFIVGKLFMCTNPCTTWVRSTFVQDEEGNAVKLPKGYRYIPFSLFDNPDKGFKEVYFNKLNKIRDKQTRMRLLYGNWDFTTTNEMAAYWNFDGERHLITALKEKSYDPALPLILSFDFNVNPFMSCLCIQVDWQQQRLLVLSEYTGSAKEHLNNSADFGRMMAKEIRKMKHRGGIIVTGDPSGRARSTQTKEGVNNYTLILKAMEKEDLQTSLRLLPKQPAQVTRLEFVNNLFDGYKNWKIEIDLRCRHLTEDLLCQKRNADGTKNKKRTVDDQGISIERYGHLSDCLDYALCLLLNDVYSNYISRASAPDVCTIRNANLIFGDFEY